MMSYSMQGNLYQFVILLHWRSEENSAWWSDYQASTKLRRKLRTSQHFEELDNFDDLLGDLTSISRTGETIKNEKPVADSSSETIENGKTVADSSSTSGYNTESPGASSCSSPEEDSGGL